MTAREPPAAGIWSRFRQQMPVAQRFAYFDHAAVSPLPAQTRDAVVRWADEVCELGDTVWSSWARRVDEVRGLAASMIGASPAEIALVSNTTAGIGLVAEGFPWQPGDNVVTLANEFPSNLYPWMNLASRGVETRRVAVEGVGVNLNRLAEACDQRTRIISVSWVGFATGWRIELGEVARLAHDFGALLFVDAIQGLGVFPLDVASTEIDFLAADGHKWLLAPEGAAILYIRGQHLDLLRPLGVGWNSVVHAHDYGQIDLTLRPAAARYEGGSWNMAGIAGLGASLELLSGLGLSADASPIAGAVLRVSDLACERLTELGARIVSDRSAERSSGIVAFQLPRRDPHVERKRCLDAGVVLSVRGGCLRISPHAYVDEGDVERLVSALR